jgi:hypothetical protein
VTEFDAGRMLYCQYLFDFFVVLQQNIEQYGCGAVGDFEPDNLRGISCNRRALLKIRISTDDHEAIDSCVLPHFGVARAFHSQQGNLLRSWEVGLKNEEGPGSINLYSSLAPFALETLVAPWTARSGITADASQNFIDLLRDHE